MFSLLCGKVFKTSSLFTPKLSKIFLKSFFHHFFLIRKLKEIQHSFDLTSSVLFQVFIPNDQCWMMVCAVYDPAKQGSLSHNSPSQKINLFHSLLLPARTQLDHSLYSANPNTVFPRFLPVGTINFSTCQDAGTIRGWEQIKGGVNITQQHSACSLEC